MCEVALVLGEAECHSAMWAYLENWIIFQMRASDMESSVMSGKKTLFIYIRKKKYALINASTFHYLTAAYKMCWILVRVPGSVKIPPGFSVSPTISPPIDSKMHCDDKSHFFKRLICIHPSFSKWKSSLGNKRVCFWEKFSRHWRAVKHPWWFHLISSLFIF